MLKNGETFMNQIHSGTSTTSETRAKSKSGASINKAQVKPKHAPDQPAEGKNPDPIAEPYEVISHKLNQKFSDLEDEGVQKTDQSILPKIVPPSSSKQEKHQEQLSDACQSLRKKSRTKTSMESYPTDIEEKHQLQQCSGQGKPVSKPSKTESGSYHLMKQPLSKCSKVLQETEIGLQKYEYRDGVLKKEKPKAADNQARKENLTKMNCKKREQYQQFKSHYQNVTGLVDIKPKVIGSAVRQPEIIKQDNRDKKSPSSTNLLARSDKWKNQNFYSDPPTANHNTQLSQSTPEEQIQQALKQCQQTSTSLNSRTHTSKLPNPNQYEANNMSPFKHKLIQSLNKNKLSSQDSNLKQGSAEKLHTGRNQPSIQPLEGPNSGSHLVITNQQQRFQRLQLLQRVSRFDQLSNRNQNKENSPYFDDQMDECSRQSQCQSQEQSQGHMLRFQHEQELLAKAQTNGVPQTEGSSQKFFNIDHEQSGVTQKKTASCCNQEGSSDILSPKNQVLKASKYGSQKPTTVTTNDKTGSSEIGTVEGLSEFWPLERKQASESLRKVTEESRNYPQKKSSLINQS